MTAIEPKAEWSTNSKPINSKEWKRGKKKAEREKINTGKRTRPEERNSS